MQVGCTTLGLLYRFPLGVRQLTAAGGREEAVVAGGEGHEEDSAKHFGPMMKTNVKCATFSLSISA